MVDDNWPFSDPRRVAVITLRQITEDGAPILLVTHDQNDGGWQFLGSGNPSPEEARVVALEEIHSLDPSIGALADLQLGWKAWRQSPEEAWLRYEVLERHESPDDVLVLEVSRDDRVGVTISLLPGWHSHPDVIAAHRGQEEDAASCQFVHEILSSKMPLAVYWKAGQITEVSPVWAETMEDVLDDPYLEGDEAITFRLWDGTEVTPESPHAS